MSITGGGGFGPKGPHSSGGVKSGVSRRASDKRKAAEAESKAGAQRTVSSDAFEIGGAKSLLGGGVQAPDGSAEPAEFSGSVDRVSQATNVVAAFEERNAQLNTEFETYRQQAQGLVDTVVQAGFSPEAIKAAKTDLDNLRSEMAQMRGRITKNNRRIKLLQSEAYNLPRFDTARMRRQRNRLGQGMGARLGAGAISMAGDVTQHTIGESQGISRLPLGGGASIDRHALGTYVSQISPVAMLSRFAVNLVESGTQFQVRPPVSTELRALHGDIGAGRAGRDLEELARYAELGNKQKL